MTENISFRFTDPYLSSYVFNSNEEFDDSVGQVAIKNAYNIDIKKLGNDRAKVVLSVKIGEKGNATPFYIEASEEALFEYDQNMDEKTRDVMLTKNAPALLLGYLRANVASMTAMTRYGAYNLPFMNFNK